MTQVKELPNPFQFNKSDVRTAVDENSDVWFCAKDVCTILDIYWNGLDTLENMPENWVLVWKLPTSKGEKEAYFINEAGLYHLTFRSNKPKAKEFANWVCAEVLPQIRKHGYFGVLPIKEYLAVVKQIADLTDRLTDTKNAFTHQILTSPLRNLCNIAGHAMPEVALISQQIDQSDLFVENQGGAK